MIDWNYDVEQAKDGKYHALYYKGGNWDGGDGKHCIVIAQWDGNRFRYFGPSSYAEHDIHAWGEVNLPDVLPEYKDNPLGIERWERLSNEFADCRDGMIANIYNKTFDRR